MYTFFAGIAFGAAALGQFTGFIVSALFGGAAILFHRTARDVRTG